MTRAQFDALLGPTGALIVGDPETVTEKILHVNESLGGISRLTFQMSVADLPHAKMLRAIELLGTRVAPLVRDALASEKVFAKCSQRFWDWEGRHRRWSINWIMAI